MTWNNVYLGTQSGKTTVLSDLSVAGTTDLQAVDVLGTLTASGTVDAKTGPWLSQMSTAAIGLASLTNQQVYFLQGASVTTIVFKSGNSIYGASLTTS